MSVIHKSARWVGTLEFKNGNRTEIWLGQNRNLGTDIVWQVLNKGRPSRVTGGNIQRLAEEIVTLVEVDGEARWSETTDPTLREHLMSYSM